MDLCLCGFVGSVKAHVSWDALETSPAGKMDNGRTIEYVVMEAGKGFLQGPPES